ncbi:hypothetical protein HanRHA438_Chr01g0021641 [Helianthus annuus]|uniref:Uncharacterized protein n=1 Tax=Helianthus annuus TaxID=4232 RepID=A0A251S4A5_HELAN|nr:hypothetical protein HanXRQr2_Chr01g0021041 [Helianthus annuus]KAJ0611570.1 hypothetical protein HanHA300_Chr01g0017241 [Helianthus annuus]KAJ0622625.1 hypothetical protein HanIR_Chr01g0022731 [Helianthus annuus]KAJ0626872.1 hypothetical protein HanHA89_Chr01g0018891 [Helianthus annuus]KAJ0783207.1 hypothetical protein HanLR1_Chr01g0017701 [Helianthus annuus]
MSDGCSLLLDEWLSDSSQRFVTFSVCCKGKVVALDNFIKCKIKTEDLFWFSWLSKYLVAWESKMLSKSLWFILPCCNKESY